MFASPVPQQFLLHCTFALSMQASEHMQSDACKNLMLNVVLFMGGYNFLSPIAWSCVSSKAANKQDAASI